MIPDPLYVFSLPFMERALVAGLLVAVVAGILGVLASVRGLALFGDGLAHMSLAGVALGIFLGVFPLGLALVLAVLAAVGIEELRQRGMAPGDVALAIFFTGGLALGMGLSSRMGGVTPAVGAYLFGSVFAVEDSYLLLVFLLSLLVVLFVLLFHRELFFLAWDPEGARVSGLPVRALSTLFMVLTASTVVLTSKIVGVLLVSSLFVVPSASALMISKSFRGALGISVGLGVLSVIVGLYASYAADLAPGPSIALTSLGVFVVAAILSRLG